MNKHLPIKVQSDLVQMGYLIKSSRQEMKLRQKDLADKLGLSAQTISKIESGSPSVEIGSFFQALWFFGILERFITLESVHLSTHKNIKRIKVKGN